VLPRYNRKNNYYHIPILVSILCLSLWLPVTAAQTEIKEVLWVTDNWKGFTEKEGSGLYHEIIDAVFHSVNVKVKKQYVPFKRSLFLLENQKADFTGGIHASDSLILTDTILLKTHISIMYFKGKLNWQTKKDLKAYIGTWPQFYEKEFLTKARRKYINGFASTTRNIALTMLQNKKADYYLDATGLLLQQFKTLDNKQQKLYKIDKLEEVNLRMAFANSSRGKRIKVLYELGIQNLHKSGKLLDIYKKYQHVYPVDK